MGITGYREWIRHPCVGGVQLPQAWSSWGSDCLLRGPLWKGAGKAEKITA